MTRGRNFYHEPLGIALTAPEGWKIQNEADAITVVNPAGDAGLVVSVAPPKAGATHEEIIRNVLQPEQGRATKLALGSLPATHFTGQRKNRQGQAQAVEATVVSGPKQQNYLLLYGAKDKAALQRARTRIQEAEASFRPLGNADLTAARPWAVRTLALPRGGFAQLARQSPLGANAEAQLRLINGFYAGDQPQPGQLVKVIE